MTPNNRNKIPLKNKVSNKLKKKTKNKRNKTHCQNLPKNNRKKSNSL